MKDIERTLDPDDWEAMRGLGHRIVDDALDYLRTVRERPAWRPVPQEVIESLQGPPPLEGVGEERAYQEFVTSVMPYPLGNIHPRFWGWVVGTGTAFGALAELAAAAMNVNASGSQSAPIYVEEQLRLWFAQLMGFPADASGLSVTGGAEANFIGIACGLQCLGGVDFRKDGFIGAARRPVLYSSTATHFSVARAVRLLGLGARSHHQIAVDRAHRMDLDALRRRIHEDRALGLQPAVLVGNAGTVACGAFDDLTALADLAAHERLWFHVDGAFGAIAALCPELADRCAGLQRADSLAFDCHKWLHVPIEAGYVLVRDAAVHAATFSVDAPYLQNLTAGVAVRPNRFTDLALQQSRAARGVKVWLTMKAYGIGALAEMVLKNVRQAQYLAERMESSECLELLAPVPLNVVCFRYVDRALSRTELNAVNERILVALHERGIAVPSSIVLDDRFGLRCAITNHRTLRADLDVLLDAVVRIGKETH